MRWDPQEYAAFSDHRSRPFFDLTARVRAENPARVVDLGCGPGELTAHLARRWPAAEVLGVDSSAEMIGRAQEAADMPANVRFELADLRQWEPAGTDVLVSNAALQWVPGHQELMRSWLQALRPGAWLAVQVPGNFRSPSHRLMRELAGSDRWRDRLAGVLRHEDAVGEPADYLDLLLEGGCRADVWETTYQQVLSGGNPVLDWVRGTALRPVLAALKPADATAFEVEYSSLLRRAYPGGPHGTVFPFRRIFCVGTKLG